MNIPSRVNPFGYDNSIPPGYTKAAFLESTGTQYIDTEWTGGCTTVTRYSAVWVASYVRYTSFWGQKEALFNSRGSMWFPTHNKYFKLYACFDVAPLVLGQIYEVKHELCDGNRAIALSVDGTRKGAGADGTYDTTISYKLFYPDASRERLYNFTLSALGELKRDLIPTLDATGRPCMFDLVTCKSFYNLRTGEFIAGMTMKSALNLANLPATGGNLTVSLPLAAVFDAAVQVALNTAADNGWTITVQYRESELTTKNIDADFLESTGTQYINTGVNFSLAEDCEWEVKAYKTVNNNAYHHIFGYRQTVDGGKICIGASYSSTAGALEIEMGKKSYWGENIDTSVPLEFRANNKVASANGKKITINNTVFDLPINNISIFRRYDIYTSMMVGRVYWLNIYNGGGYVMRVVPAIDSTGRPCMYDAVSGQNFYNANTSAGATPFIVGFDTTDKAAVSLSKLPVTTGGTLTVSLPAAAEDTTTLVPAAIDIAKARGWTIITQYRED